MADLPSPYQPAVEQASCQLPGICMKSDFIAPAARSDSILSLYHTPDRPYMSKEQPEVIQNDNTGPVSSTMSGVLAPWRSY